MRSWTLRWAGAPLALAALLLLALGLARPAGAQQAGWCVQCHAATSQPGQGLPLVQLAWQGPEAQASLSPCPAVVRANKELLETEGRLADLMALLPALSARRLHTAPLEQGLARAAGLYRLALAQPVASVEDISVRLGRVQAVLQERVEAPLREQEARQQRGAAWGLVIMALLLLALAGLVGLRRLYCRPGSSPPLAQVRQGRIP